jgi:hypothetical protein
MLIRVLLVVALLFAAVPAGADAVSVKRGKALGERIFPSDAFSVRDKRQATGRRVHFRLGRDYPLVKGRVRPDCTKRTYTICDAYAQLNTLDGFDLQPRVTVPFTGRVDLDSVTDETVFISTPSGKFVSGLRQVTFDPERKTLAGITTEFLREGTRYRVNVTRGLKDARGKRVGTCGRVCRSPFTTRTATGLLTRIRRALDRRPPSTVDFVQDGKELVFPALSVGPSVSGPANGIRRTDQVRADPEDPEAFRTAAVPNLIPPSSAGFYAFGSFLAPRYQFASRSAHRDSARGPTDGVIPVVSTRRAPRPLGTDRLGAIVVTPDPAAHPPPWPAAVYGPGFTRSKYDIFVSADQNAARGILTIATDPAGHAYGPRSTTTVTSDGEPTTFLSHGRGRDLDGDGRIGSGLNDGVGPTGHTVKGAKRQRPSHKPLDGVASGLAQTATDNMVLGRALAGGLDIPGVGQDLVDPERISYYGISFGGIYGTMIMGTDPLFRRGLLNVPGGPIADIARLSAFRGDLADQLERSRPNMLNGGPGLDGFTEDLPLPTEEFRVVDVPGAVAVQELIAASNWYDRYASPETFAPRIRLRPDPAWADAPKEVLFQIAYGDGTVPNPTSATLLRAGDLFDRTTLYRNDRTATFEKDPHGFLADPSVAGRTPGQQQLAEFLATGAVTNPSPGVFEVPIADPNSLECLHYPDPQTGQEQTREPFPASGSCPPPPEG